MLLRHAHIGQQPSAKAPPGLESLFEMRSKWLTRLNAPDHTRLRGLIREAFSARIVNKLRDFVQATSDELLRRFQGRGRMDVIEDFAYPLPMTVLCHMLGIPAEDQRSIRNWAKDIVRGTARIADKAERQQAADSAHHFLDYVRHLVESKDRDQSGDDLLTHLVKARTSDAALSLDELYGICTLLVFAGHETSTNLIGNGLLALLRNPAQMKKLQDNPDVIDAAVQELLRYDSPVQKVSRFVLKDVKTDRFSLLAGESLVLLLGAANRDPARFVDSDTLDILRADNRHLAFGSGHHACPGATLATLEGRIAFTSLMKLQNLRLAEAPTYRPHDSLRGLSSLVVSYDG